MDIYGAGKNGTRVEVNEDFSILIPYGCIYTTEIEDDSQIVFRLAKPKELPASYREGRLTFGDEEDEQKWILEIKRTEISSEKLEPQLSELDIQEQISSSLKSTAEKLNNETEGITSLFGGSSAEYIGTHSLIDRQDLKCGYGLLKSMGKLLIMVIIGTPRNIYVSGKMTEDLQVELFLNKMLRSICLIEDVNDDVKSEKTDTLQDDELFVAVRPPEIIGNDAVYCNGTPMDGIRFFLPVTIHQEMINDKTGAVDVSVFQKGDSISIDVIEQPIHCNVQKTEEGVLTLDLFIRSEIGHFSEPDLGMTLYADGRETEIRNKGRIGGDASMTLAVFLKAAAKLRKAITEQGLVEEYRNADPEKEGLLVAKNEDQFSFKLVSGRKRPSMTCTTLLNGIQIGRPYKDETMEAWKRGLMPEEGLEELAESGDEAAMNDLANAYLNGDGVEQNYEKSLYWWKKLAECNDPTGQYNVGLYYAKGCGVERDFEKAAEWMRKSSENGDKDAEKLVDLFAKAGENFRKAESGDAEAQAEVANLMMYLGRSVTVPGIDSEDEFKEAVKWAQKAADNGSGEGCWILGLAYEHGRGVKEDLNLAIEYFEKGVNLGHAKCMGNLGAIYMNGQVKGKTKEDGFRLMKKAAELGDVHSMKNVGSCYQFGNGVDDSMRKAVYWYEKYLEHEEDEELERKVRIFKTLPVLMEDESEEGEEDKTEKNTEEKAASGSKKSQLSQVNQLIAESRKEYQKHIDRWDRECNEIIDDISSKSYSYEFEADADIRKIIRGRDGFGRKLEALIKDFDEKAGKIFKDEDDYASLKRINDYIKEIFEDTPNLNISVDAYGDRSGKYKEDEFSFSIDSKRIYRKWQDKLHNTSQYKKEQEEKRRAEEERRKAEAERRKKEMEERRIREEKERKRREEEQKKAEEERKRAEEEARKKAIAEKYYKAIKDERTGSKESLESAITAYKELGDYEESVSHIESCKHKLDEVIRLEKEEEARRLEEEAQKKARMKKLGVRIGIAAMIIVALLLIAKLTQAYLEEKARKDAYNNAVTLMEDGKYDEAIEGFKALEGYEDSEVMITEAENRKAYAAAEELLEAGKFEEAKKAFENLGDFSDSKKRVEEIIEQQNANAYAEAEKLLAEGKYDEAIKKFQELGNYSDSAKRVEEAKTAKNESLYKQAAEYAEKEEYSKSLDIFEKLGSYKDSAAKAEEMQELYNEQEYEAAEELMDEGNYQAAQSKFERLGDYADSSDRAQEAKEAAEEQKEQEEIRKSWSEPQFISSKAGGFYVFTFEWSDGATQPEVYFEDGAGKHHLTVTEISKNKIELYDSRGVNHTLTRQSDGGVYWRWESSTMRFE